MLRRGKIVSGKKAPLFHPPQPTRLRRNGKKRGPLGIVFFLYAAGQPDLGFFSDDGSRKSVLLIFGFGSLAVCLCLYLFLFLSFVFVWLVRGVLESVSWLSPLGLVS